MMQAVTAATDSSSQNFKASEFLGSKKSAERSCVASSSYHAKMREAWKSGGNSQDPCVQASAYNLAWQILSEGKGGNCQGEEPSSSGTTSTRTTDSNEEEEEESVKELNEDEIEALPTFPKLARSESGGNDKRRTSPTPDTQENSSISVASGDTGHTRSGEKEQSALSISAPRGEHFRGSPREPVPLDIAVEKQGPPEEAPNEPKLKWETFNADTDIPPEATPLDEDDEKYSSAEKHSSRKKAKKKTNQIDKGSCEVSNARGTKFMSSIGLNTILIHMTSRKFLKGMVHYVILTPVAEPTVKIPAVLMSHPNPPNHKRTTRDAEVLPLLTPGSDGRPTLLLKHKPYRKLFRNGTQFRLRVVAFGRSFKDGSHTPAELKQACLKDIMNVPWKDMLKKCVQDERRMDMSRSSANQTAETQRLSHYIPDLRIRGLSASGGKRNFAAWFAWESNLPPGVKIDNNFKCDVGVLKRDNFTTHDQLFRYLGISDVV